MSTTAVDFLIVVLPIIMFLTVSLFSFSENLYCKVLNSTLLISPQFVILLQVDFGMLIGSFGPFKSYLLKSACFPRNRLQIIVIRVGSDRLVQLVQPGIGPQVSPILPKVRLCIKTEVNCSISGPTLITMFHMNFLVRI